jgi:hypothetical protein
MIGPAARARSWLVAGVADMRRGCAEASRGGACDGFGFK